jgi:hypothetical protein
MNEQLKQLVIAVQREPRGTGERQRVLTELVEQMLRSRKICRFRQGQALTGVYLDIFHEIQQKLSDEVDLKIDQYNLERPGVSQWISEQRDRVFQQVLDETCLKKLALEAQQYEPQSQERQYALQELLHAILLSGKLRRQGTFSDYVYRDAVNQTLSYIYQKIDAYQPKRGKFVGWVNYRLEMVLRETDREKDKDRFTQSVTARTIRLKYQLTSLVRRAELNDVHLWLKFKFKRLIPDVFLGMEIGLLLAALVSLSQLMVREPIVADALLFEMAKQVVGIPAMLSEHQLEPMTLENIPAPEVELTLLDKVRQYIADDPKKLCQKHIREHPEATFQEIALKRLEGESWKQLSAQFGIGIPTLSNFFQRQLKGLVTEIRKYIE